MPRKAFRLTSHRDTATAVAWISKKLYDPTFVLGDPDDPQDRTKENARQHWNLHKTGAPEQVQAWCERWLDAPQWTRLRNAIRARNSYQQQHHHKVTLSETAYLILSTIAAHEGLTYSETLQRYLNERYDQIINEDNQ